MCVGVCGRRACISAGIKDFTCFMRKFLRIALLILPIIIDDSKNQHFT